MTQGKYALIPYAVVDGVPSFRDSEIAGWYERLEAEGLARWVFFDAGVLSGDELVRLVKIPGHYTFTVWAQGDERPEMAAFFWINRFIGRSAFVHFAIFKKFHGADARDIGRFVLSEILRMEMVETVLGLTPANNPHSIRYVEEIGMQRIGTIPGVFFDAFSEQQVDGVLISKTKES